MSNPIIDKHNEFSMCKAIAERDGIINHYNSFGILNRADAIHKIQELRLTDKEVAEVTAVQQIISSVPLNAATDAQLIGELMLQRNILQAKLTIL